MGYRWYESQDIDPLFAFGHGLTYTTFRYSKLRVTPVVVNGRSEVRIAARLRNTGRRAGTETAQAYLQLPRRTGEPPRRLVGWKQVTLAPGAAKNVEIRLPAKTSMTFGYFSTGVRRRTNGPPPAGSTPCTSAARRHLNSRPFPGGGA